MQVAGHARAAEDAALAPQPLVELVPAVAALVRAPLRHAGGSDGGRQAAHRHQEAEELHHRARHCPARKTNNNNNTRKNKTKKIRKKEWKIR